MALKDNASLALIPAAYKTSKVYSALPTDGDGDFNFSRTGSATRVNKAGLIQTMASNEPRLDYPLLDGVVQSCPTLLLEPSRENKYPYSSEINSTRWTSSSGGTGSTPVMNSSTEVAKDGSLTASEWVFDTGSGTSSSDQSNIYYSSISTSVGITYSFSVWVYSSLDNVEIQLRGAGTTYEKFTLSVGWNRITRIADATSTSTLPVIGLRQSVNGTVNNNITVKLWGAQFEQGSYATSYIPTSGSTTTRNADTCNGAGDSSTFNDSEGVLFAEIANIDKNNTTDTVTISISDGTLNNAVTFYYFTTGGVYYNIFNSSGIRSGNVSMTKSEQANFNKIALKYKSTDIALWVNGFEVSTNIGTLTLSGLSELAFDYGNGGFDFYGKVKQVMVFNEALTDSELEELTT